MHVSCCLKVCEYCSFEPNHPHQKEFVDFVLLSPVIHTKTISDFLTATKHRL